MKKIIFSKLKKFMFSKNVMKLNYLDLFKTGGTINIVPETYRTKGFMKKYSLDDFVADKINKAVESALSDTKRSYPRPSWFKENSYNRWLDCISTALSNFMPNPPTGNRTFAANPQKYGFRKLEKNEPLQIGDVGQVMRFNIPYHGILVTGFDKNGNPLHSYSNGYGIYRKNTTDWREETNVYYRYVGTEDERRQIEEHNAQVAEEQKIQQAADSAVRMKSTGFDIQPIQIPNIRLR